MKSIMDILVTKQENPKYIFSRNDSEKLLNFAKL